jgi:hypothetical protein
VNLTAPERPSTPIHPQRQPLDVDLAANGEPHEARRLSAVAQHLPDAVRHLADEVESLQRWELRELVLPKRANGVVRVEPPSALFRNDPPLLF